MAFKYVFVLENQRDYLHAEDDPDQREYEYSVIRQTPLSNEVRTDVPMMVHRTEVSYAHFPWSPIFERRQKTIFSTRAKPSRLIPYKNNW